MVSQNADTEHFSGDMVKRRTHQKCFQLGVYCCITMTIEQLQLEQTNSNSRREYSKKAPKPVRELGSQVSLRSCCFAAAMQKSHPSEIMSRADRGTEKHPDQCGTNIARGFYMETSLNCGMIQHGVSNNICTRAVIRCLDWYQTNCVDTCSHGWLSRPEDG
eukprot:5211020-Amphidinium_carterae.2